MEREDKLHIVDDYPHDLDLLSLTLSNSNIGTGEHYWVREFYIKEIAKKAISSLNDEDIIFISDAYEFWDPSKLIE